MADRDKFSDKRPDKAADELLLDRNKFGEGLPNRLREALAGRNRHDVLSAAAISERTLNRILSGESTKRGTIIALAQACGVSRSWLIYGTGHKHEYQAGDINQDGDEIVQMEPIPLRFDPPDSSERPTFNMDRMGTALAAADAMFAAEHKSPSPRQRVQAMLLIYNHLTDVQAQIDAAENEKNISKNPVSSEES